MYYIKKEIEISGAHRLQLPYTSKCTNMHGHNWIIHIYCKATQLNSCGMIVDFSKVKELIQGKLDHQFINEVLPELNPTAENLAKWICDEISKICETGYCYRVDVQESEGNIASYILGSEDLYEHIRNL